MGGQIRRRQTLSARTSAKPTQTWAADPALADQARNNTLDNFKLAFDPKFLDTVIPRMDANEAIFKIVLDDEEFREVLADFDLRKVYSRLRNQDR